MSWFRHAAALAIALALATFAGTARAEDTCAGAAALWPRGALEAERIARACVEAAPEDGDRVLALAQVLAWQSRYDEALVWIDRGRSAHPENAELAALRLRVLGWAGRQDDARAAEATLPAAVAGDPDVLRARADLALWRGEHAAAVAGYDAYLARRPDDAAARRSRALAQLEVGREAEAREELASLCRTGDAAACNVLGDLDERRYTAFVQAGPVADGDGLAGWIGRASLDAALSARLHVGGALDVQERRFGGEAARDSIVGLNAGWLASDRVLLSAGVGAAIAPEFSPDWNAHAEIGLRAGSGFWFYLRYWHLEFATNGVEVVSPAIGWEGDGVRVLVRAWRGFEPDRDPSLALLGQATFALAGPLEATLGAGGGDRADYLDLRSVAVQRHVIALAGLGLRLDDAYQLRADWLGRWERAGGERFRRDELLLGLRRTW